MSAGDAGRSGSSRAGRSRPISPLLSEIFYLERALGPFAEIRKGTIAELLRAELAVLVLADIGQIVGPDRAAIDDWLAAGGVLIRFAGPRMTEAVDNLVSRSPPPRRPRSRRRAQLVGAGAACAVRRAKPVLRPADPRRCAGAPPGSGRARPRPRGADLGPAQRRHAFGDIRETRQRALGAVSHHRQHGLGQPGALRPVRRDAAQDRRPLPWRDRQ